MIRISVYDHFFSHNHNVPTFCRVAESQHTVSEITASAPDPLGCDDRKTLSDKMTNMYSLEFPVHAWLPNNATSCTSSVSVHSCPRTQPAVLVISLSFLYASGYISCRYPSPVPLHPSFHHLFTVPAIRSWPTHKPSTSPRT